MNVLLGLVLRMRLDKHSSRRWRERSRIQRGGLGTNDLSSRRLALKMKANEQWQFAKVRSGADDLERDIGNGNEYHRALRGHTGGTATKVVLEGDAGSFLGISG